MILAIICIVGIIIIFIGIGGADSLIKNGDDIMKKRYAKQNLDYISTPVSLKYVCGFKDISINIKVFRIVFTKQGIIIDFLSTENKVQKIIKWKDIDDISFETESSIQQQVKISNLIIFGSLAFGMKQKKSKIVEEYIVISVDDEEGKHSYLFKDTFSNQKMLNTLKKYKEDYGI